ncbi:MAG: ThiF family adenylyltransferase [Scytonematopsis contorta HA4267-MV1]|jgi:molybdopterin/thiamine biosynthesis adenylyltransferase|nr:ThiF family adenylyltransferase [Scytonematopsis contorta HA4267-MV1]
MKQLTTTTNWENVEINLPSGMYFAIQEHMLSCLENEQFGVILAGYSYAQKIINKKRHDFLRLLGREYIIPTENDLDYAHYTGVSLTREFNNRILKIAVKEKLCIIHVHSHPFSSGSVEFSAIDDHFEAEEAAWLGKNFPIVILGSIVVGKNSLAARVWNLSTGVPKPVNVSRIVGCDFPLRIINCNKTSSSESLDGMHDRQVRAFGKEGQQLISSLKIGIVGLGGTGSLMAEGLARLGVKRFVLVDADRVEETNRNRLLGLTQNDVHNRSFKVSIARRVIRQVKTECEVRMIRKNAATESATSELKTCDLLVSATDNYYSRLFLQTVCEQYLIPLINMGVIINTDGEKIIDAFGDVQLFLPGSEDACLLCAGLINMTEVNRELASDNLKQMMTEQGYIQNVDIPDPSVRHLNGITTNLALEIFHNLICNFKEPVLSLSYNMLVNSIEQCIYRKDNHCRICGENGVTGLGDTLPLTYYFNNSK